MKTRHLLTAIVGMTSMLATAQTVGYDFVVPTDGTFRQAIEAANDRRDTLTRFRIFVRRGTYVTDTKGTTTGGDGREYGDPRTRLSAPFTSIIGEERDATVITNSVPEPTWNNGFGRANPLEGIGRGDVLIIETTAHDTYMQDITIRSGMGDNTGRNIALNDNSERTAMKNICLWGYQDTYVSHNGNGRYYFEGGVIRGRTDYVCGKGDVLYNGVTLQQCGKGGYLAVPSVPRKYGYVFLNCHVKKETPDVSFYLGRPWGKGTPTARFVNTTLDTAPLKNGWADMSGGWPAQFAEYASHLPSGEMLSLDKRRTEWTDRDKQTHANNPRLTKDEADMLTPERVMECSREWNPLEQCRQAAAVKGLRLKNGALRWKRSKGATFYAICRNGSAVAFTKGTSFTLPADASATDRWSIRAANAMGGLGAPTDL